MAALVVFIPHTEQLKSIFGHPSAWSTSASIAIMGKLGVVLFFVLSGFLITYLLLEEERQTGRIAIGRFYLRRALRIWPLYYAFIALALFVLPHTTLFFLPGYSVEAVHEDLLLKVALYATLFANVVHANVGFVPFAALTWSIATEEQFYLIWPLLMRWVRNKLVLMLAVIVLYLAGRYFLESGLAGSGSWQTGVLRFYSLFNIDCMAIGGLAAVLLHRKSRLLALLVNRPVFYAALATTVALLARGVTVPHLHYEAYSVLFAVLILNFSSNRRLGWSLEFEPFRYLGKISYGLYLLHPLAIVATIRLLGLLGEPPDVILYPVSLLATIGLAALSYRYFESPFLRLKNRYAVVASGEDARNARPHSAAPRSAALTSAPR